MKLPLLLLICFSTTLAFSQSKKFNFQIGSEYSLPRKSEDLSFMGNNKTGIVNLSLKKDELFVSRFDPVSLNLTNEQTIVLPERTKNFNSEQVVDFGGNYFWLHSDWDKDAEKEMLFYDIIDVASGKLAATNTKIIETTRLSGSLVPTGFYRAKTMGKYQFDFDADTTKLLVSYRLAPEEKNDKKNYDKIGLHVFDNKMNKLWGNEFTMPYTEAIMDNSDFSIDSKGNAYMLAKVYDSEKRKEVDKETGKAGYHYEVLKFTKDSKQIIHTTISIDDYFIKETSLVENSVHEMVIACTYSKKAKRGGTDGIFLAMMDATGKINKYKNGYYEFPLEELEKYESGRTKRKMERKDDYETPNLKVRNVLVNTDGSIFIVGEIYYVVSTTYTTGNGYMQTTYTYYYEDIIGTKINAAGNVDWVRKIPKQQRGANGTGTMSFKLVNDATGYYFLYLDNKKNMELKEDEAPKYHVDGWGGQVVVAHIDTKGVVSKEIVFDTREEDIMIFPARFTKINGNQFIGRVNVKRGDYKPLLITVK